MVKRQSKIMMCVVAVLLLCMSLFTSCRREPDLHLHGQCTDMCIPPAIDVNLEVYWDYELIYGIQYDWQAEWYYGWDEEDRKLFGDLGYTDPKTFQGRRYYTGYVPNGPHRYVVEDYIDGYSFRARFDWGFWDLLIWNNITTIDGVQSLIFDESTSLDYVTAYTNQTMNKVSYSKPAFSRSFYQPEPLFSAYEQGVEINKNMDGFIYNEEENVYVKTLNMKLEPITYIYLTQIILKNNERGRITGVDGTANLSGMARSVCLNDGVAGSDQITVNYNVRFKKNCDMDGEKVDIAGGRLLTFGMCNINANRVVKNSRGPATRVDDGVKHYMDVNFQFYNGRDSTYVFDVTDQVQTRYKGGVLTVILDANDIPVPIGTPGGGFDASVLDPEEVTKEIPM